MVLHKLQLEPTRDGPRIRNPAQQVQVGVFLLEHVRVISFVGHTKGGDPKVGTLKTLIYTKGKVVSARTHPAIPLPLYAMVRG